MPVRLARGPVVEAFKRYDPGLRVRWSYEKRKWAVEHKAKPTDQLVPPVYFERIGDKGDNFEEHMLSEFSDKHIAFHDGYYTICWSVCLDWRLYHAVVRRDWYRRKGTLVQQFDEKFMAEEAAKKKAMRERMTARSEQAYDRYKHVLRKMPWADPSAVGVGKEEIIAVEKKAEKRLERMFQ